MPQGGWVYEDGKTVWKDDLSGYFKTDEGVPYQPSEEQEHADPIDKNWWGIQRDDETGSMPEDVDGDYVDEVYDGMDAYAASVKKSLDPLAVSVNKLGRFRLKEKSSGFRIKMGRGELPRF